MSNITREEAIKELTHELRIWESECKSVHPMKDALKMAIEALNRPQGEWIERHEIINQITFFGENRCSNCRKRSFIKSDFCPNCGADMRGGK